MAVVMRIEGLSNGLPTEYDGSYVQRFDFEGMDVGAAVLETTRERERARRFADALTALEFWRQLDRRCPTRLDGRPNRPLTAFSVTIEPA